MPTVEKEAAVVELADRIKRSTIAIATDFSGLGVNQITELRRQLRVAGVEYKVVKNRIAKIAARQGPKPESDATRWGSVDTMGLLVGNT